MLARLSRRTGLEVALLQAMSVVVAGTVLASLDNTMVNVAFDHLSQEFDAPIVSTQWITNAYTLALACVMPVSGWLARRVGTRRLFLVALSTFVAGSVLCGLAWSLDSLVAFRVLQGIGGGAMLPTGQMIVARGAGPSRMGRAMGLITTAVIFAPILGPSLGGVVVDTLSWRWIFLVNLPIGAVAIWLGLRHLPRSRDPAPGAIDVIGFVLLSIGLPLLTYGLSEMGRDGHLDDPRALAPVAAGLLLIVAFVLHALRSRFPLLDVRLFRAPALGAAGLTMFVLGMSQMTAIVLTPLYFQEVRGTSALTAGMMFAPLSVGIGIAAAISGRIVDRIGGGRVALVGIGLMILGGLPLALITDHSSYWALGAALFVRGLGLGAGTMPVMAAAYRALRPEQVPDAAPQLTMVQRAGSAVGLAIYTAVLEHGLHGARAAGGTSAQLAGAYATTFRSVLIVAALALIPAGYLAVVERRAQAAERGAPAAA